MKGFSFATADLEKTFDRYNEQQRQALNELIEKRNSVLEQIEQKDRELA